MRHGRKVRNWQTNEMGMKKERDEIEGKGISQRKMVHGKGGKEREMAKE